MRKGFVRTVALAALLTLAGCGIIPDTNVPSSTASPNISSPVSLEQVGGVRVILGVGAAHEAQTLAGLVARAREGLGVSGASGKALPDAQVEIDLPGFTDRAEAVNALSAQGVVRFIDTSGNPLFVGTTVGAQQYPTLFTGSQIDPASVAAQTDSQFGQPIVTFEFKGAAASQFAQYTGSHIGQYLTVTLDNRVIESATIQSRIAGLGQIMDNLSLGQAQTLAACLKSGALPAPVTLVSASVVRKGAKQAGGGGLYLPSK